MSDPSSPEERLWNESAALSNVGGDVADLKDLLHIWLEQVPNLLSDIESALQERNPERLYRAAHTLKSSLQLFGMDACVEVAESLELAGRMQHLDHCENGRLQLPRLIQKVTAQVRVFLNLR